MAVVIAGLFIAGAIYFSGGGGIPSRTTTTGSTTGTQNAAVPTIAQQPGQQVAADAVVAVLLDDDPVLGDPDAPVTIIAIGLFTAQFVITTGTLARSKSNEFTLVSALERNYANP